MTSNLEFRPNWISPPGDTIRDLLRQKGLEEAQLSALLDRPGSEVGAILEGRLAISLQIARALERVLGPSSAFWMARDVQYRQDAARLHPQDGDWLKSLPVRDMLRFGWLSAVAPSEETEACLRFFNQPSVEAWRSVYAGLGRTAFRTSGTFENDLGPTAAWLREGEIEAAGLELGEWDPERFAGMMSGLRSLTRVKSPGVFLPQLQERCAEAGVAVVVVRAPSGCRASGATRFVSPNRALLLLSFRYLTDDHFWFTFFHEAAHLLMHAERRLLPDAANDSWILEIEAPVLPDREAEANDFARSILVPDEFQEEMLRLPRRTDAIVRFARRVGVSPGVVVGQLQHAQVFQPAQMNSLKRRFSWTD